MSALLVADIAAQADSQLGDVFGGNELALRTQVVRANLDEEKGGEVRYLAAGVRDIDFADVTINGDVAQVQVTATVWAKLAQVQEGGDQVIANPENEMIYDITLEKVDGRWLVMAESMSFAPGSTP
jgi:hypothetical protein